MAAGQRLDGKMWWNDEAAAGFLREFVLFPGRFYFAVEDDGCLFRGTLHLLDGTNYRGSFSFAGSGKGSVWCTLVPSDSEYRLRGKWKQSDNVETFDWNAVLERL